MSDVLSYENFAAQANTKFVLLDRDEPFELELIEISEPNANERQMFFSLFFRGDKTFALSQGTYRMKHATLGEMLIFLVPTERGADGSHKYEAVFNLLNKEI